MKPAGSTANLVSVQRAKKLRAWNVLGVTHILRPWNVNKILRAWNVVSDTRVEINKVDKTPHPHKILQQ